jgi:hypothetical protein
LPGSFFGSNIHTSAEHLSRHAALHAAGSTAATKLIHNFASYAAMANITATNTLLVYSFASADSVGGSGNVIGIVGHWHFAGTNATMLLLNIEILALADRAHLAHSVHVGHGLIDIVGTTAAHARGHAPEVVWGASRLHIPLPYGTLHALLKGESSL